jgi:hypothetical protein
MAAGHQSAVAPNPPGHLSGRDDGSVSLDRRPWVGTVYRAVGLTRGEGGDFGLDRADYGRQPSSAT